MTDCLFFYFLQNVLREKRNLQSVAQSEVPESVRKAMGMEDSDTQGDKEVTTIAQVINVIEKLVKWLTVLLLTKFVINLLTDKLIVFADCSACDGIDI